MKDAIARELINTPCPQQFVPGKSSFPKDILTAEANPTLEQFVGPKSGLLFELLGMRGGLLVSQSHQ